MQRSAGERSGEASGTRRMKGLRPLVIGAAVLLAAGALWHALGGESSGSSAAIVRSQSPTRPKERSDASSTITADPRPDPRETVASSADSSREPELSVAIDTAVPPRRAVRVRLLDDRTGEAVPFLAVLVEDDSTSERLVSDAEGIVAGELERARATLRIALPAEPTEGDRIQVRRREVASIPISADFEHDPAVDIAGVALPVGPTYRLRVAPPAGYALGKLAASLRAADPRQAFDVAFAGVSQGDPPWTRFRATAHLLEGGPPWKLEIATRDGLWVGSAEVATREGIHPGVLAIVLEARARLTGRVLDSEGAPVPDHLVRLDRPGSDFDDQKNRPIFTDTDAEGRFEIARIPPGPYELWTDLARHEKFSQRVALAPGESRDIEIELVVSDEPADQRIELRVESRTGRFDQRVYVSLKALGPDPWDEFGEDVVWHDEGDRKVGRVVFEHLREGNYRLRLTARGANDVEPR